MAEPVRQIIERDGLKLTAHVTTNGSRPLVLQHGLCGDAGQPIELLDGVQGVTHFVLECRGHGASEAGDPENFSIRTFAGDVAAMMDEAGLKAAAIGGVSMGAAIALRLAVIRPDLVSALILIRPAWVTQSAPVNMAPNALAGQMILEGKGRGAFLASPTAMALASEAPDNLASLAGFFLRQPLAVTGELLVRISADGPGVSEAQLAALGVPVCILASEEDVIHPFAHAQTLAALIPSARLTLVPSKGRDKPGHLDAIRSRIADFLVETA